MHCIPKLSKVLRLRVICLMNASCKYSSVCPGCLTWCWLVDFLVTSHTVNFYAFNFSTKGYTRVVSKQKPQNPLPSFPHPLLQSSQGHLILHLLQCISDASGEVLMPCQKADLMGRASSQFSFEHQVMGMFLTAVPTY